jgi:multiple sugar transport system substrate-binding protein
MQWLRAAGNRHLPRPRAAQRTARRLAVLAAVSTCVALAGKSAPALAGEQADRAVAAVRQLVAQGEIKFGTVLILRVKQGNMASLLGRGHELRTEWERQTGTSIDAGVMPQVDSLGLIRKAVGVDLMLARNHEYPDLHQGGLIEDLEPLVRRFGFTLPEDSRNGYMLLRQQAYFGDHLVAIPADMDLAMLFVRRDLLEDPGHRDAFRKKHGRELRAPATWQEYQQLVEFYARPQDGFYGSAEPRERLTGWMYWLPRYLSSAAPNQHLFDDGMRPLVDSPAGIAATESYIASVPYMPPQSLEDGKDYSYTLPIFLRGDAFATMLTVAAAKIANRDDSPIRGKFMAVPMPGHVVAGRLVRRTPFIYGNNFVVPVNAPNKALALLFAMWLTDPDNTTRSVAANGIADPYRHSSLRDEQVRSLYTAQALDVLENELPVAAPSGTGLPGDSEYLAALSRNIWLAARRELTPRQAMAKTAREWDAITDRHGRSRQIGHWRTFKNLYPQGLQ